jgi:pimeloyl-ACP methyl ester carboxylesterase
MMGKPQSNPTVILDAGMISFSSNWAWVQPEVAKVARVVAYDRAGLGWSDATPTPRDAGHAAQELFTALDKLGVKGPYVMVGHSYGGMVSRAFAGLYRDEVVGMVLVDASHPDQWVRMGFPSRLNGSIMKVFSVFARFGLWRVFNSEYKLLAGGLPSRQYAELLAFAPTPSAQWTVGDTLIAWDSISRVQVNQAGDLGDLPLIVLSVTEQPLKGKQLTELQAELPRLSTNSQHITVVGATHEGLVSQPQYARVVTDAILRVVEAARACLPLNRQAVTEPS